MAAPTVSVIMPTYNYARYVAGALESVLAQTRPPHEVIVVDDGSTDATPEILAAFGSRIRVIRQQNQGGAASRNTGAAAATGDLLAFIDSDDRWMPAKLERQVARFLEDPALGLVHCGVLEIDAAGRPLRRVTRGAEGWITEKLLLFREPVILGGSSGMVVPRAVFEEVGGIDARLFNNDDWDLWYRIGLRYRVGFIPELLVQYRRHSGSLSGNIPRIEQGVLRIYDKAFAEAPPAIQRLRRRAYGNLHIGIAGFYLRAGQPGPALHRIACSLAMTPENVFWLLGYPFRAAWRRVHERPLAGVEAQP